jgi:hypothetical protein
MFIGHFGVGFAAKKAAPTVSLGLLFMAVQFLDLLWPTLLLLGIEHVQINTDASQTTPLAFIDYPISHSLVMVLVWSVLFGGIYWIIKKNTSGAIMLGLCVLSHWVLDLIVHYPDLPIYPGNSPKVGLGLWNRLIAENIIELIIFITGIVFYVQSTKPKNKFGIYGLWLLIGMLLLSYLANIFAPKPTDTHAIAWGAQFMWLFVILAFFVDKNRTRRTALQIAQ